MRYIIEAAALHAKLLNRTLIIPSYVYAKSCEGKMSGIVLPAGKMDSDEQCNSELCATYATMVWENTGMQEDKWDAQPLNEKRYVSWAHDITIARY